MYLEGNRAYKRTSFRVHYQCIKKADDGDSSAIPHPHGDPVLHIGDPTLLRQGPPVISHGWPLGPGLRYWRGLSGPCSLQVWISPVTSSSPSASPFWLVGSFSHSAIRIHEDSMSLIVQSCLGGTAKDFRVSMLRDWCFRFAVVSKQVGIMIHHLKRISCSSFDLHFTLWHDGGPDSVHEK